MIFETLNNKIKEKYIHHNEDIKRSIDELLNKTENIEEFTNLIKVEEKFKLNKIEKEIILILFSSEIYSKYNKIYAYLHEDLNKPYPNLELIIKLLCNNSKDEEYLYKYFTSNSKLNALCLIKCISTNDYEPLFQQAIKLSDTLRDYIFGNNFINKSLKSYSIIFEPLEQKANFKELPFHILDSKQYLINICGNSEEQNKQKALQICTKLNYGMLFVDTRKALEIEKNIDMLLSILVRDALLSESIIYFENLDFFYEQNNTLMKEKFIRKIEELTWITLFSSKTIYKPNNLPRQFEFYSIKEKIYNNLEDKNSNIYAKHIISTNTLEDIVLPIKQKKQLLEIMSHYKFQDEVYNGLKNQDKFSA